MSVAERLVGVVLVVHRRLYQVTRGLVGHRMLGVPTLLLTTRGRRTGRQRTVALVYVAEGDDLVVVASNGGSPTHPAWYLNLTADPGAQVRVGRASFAVTARDADAGERQRWWAMLNAVNRDRFDQYRARTTRRIPVVALRRSRR
jgi:deazaflavin-dependent oxidoreductase (nitroreductase family)